MKKMVLLIMCMFCLASTSLAAPAAPQMSYLLNGTNITVDWSTVPEATAYALYYAKYPYRTGDHIGSLDRGNNNSYSIDLWDGAAYYIATRARNAQGSSGYSNVEYFIMKDHELIWEDRATLGSPRTQFAGGVIDDMIYSFGGYDENGLLLNSLEVYDPTEDSWTFGTANTKSVADLSSAVVSKKLYVFGATGDECSTTPFAEKYDPNTEQWSTLASKTTQTSGAPAVAYNGKIYLFGGWQRSTCNDTGKVLRKSVEAYNPTTNSWQVVTTMPKALEGATVAVYDDKAYLMGGVDEQGNYATDIIAYDFTTDSWTESGLGSLNAPRMFPASSSAPVIEDTIVLVGGWVENAARSANTNRVESNQIELFNPRARSVAIGEPLPEANAGHLIVVLGGELYLIGGVANARVTSRVQHAGVTISNANNTTYLTDSDGDGYTAMQGDCDDSNPLSNPGAAEICGDNIDNDCSGYADDYSDCADADGDGDGYTIIQGDCSDSDPGTYPGAMEICYDGIDNNCSGYVDEPFTCVVASDSDFDGDGYSTIQGDCNDNAFAINPAAEEVCGDGLDQDCSGSDLICDEDIDADGDGYTVIQGDCDDSKQEISPSAFDICDDGIDQDCSGGDAICGVEVIDAPMFQPSPGTFSYPRNIALSSGDADATIYYTTDGSTPTINSNLYTSPLYLSTTQTIRAIAFKEGSGVSPVATGTFAFSLRPVMTPSPGIYDVSQSIRLTASAGAAIYYTTDGSTPTIESNLYTAPLIVSATQTIKAIAIFDDIEDSAVTTGTYTITNQTFAPTFSPAPGVYYYPQNVSLSSASDGASLRYSTDGTSPTRSYSFPLPVSTSQTIKAIAVKSGIADSEITSGNYTIRTVNGVWSLGITAGQNSCNQPVGQSKSLADVTVTQSGQVITVVSSYETNTGTLVANRVSWNMSMPDGDGTLSLSFQSILSDDGNSFSGPLSFTYTEGTFSCSGSGTGYGSR